MARTVRPVLVGILAATVALSGCAAQVGGAAVGGNVGPAVPSSSPEFSVVETTSPTTPEVTTAPTPQPTTAEESTGAETTEPSTDAETTDPSTSEGSTGASADTRGQQFVAMIADGMSGVTSYEGKISTDMGATGGSMTGTMRGTVKDGTAENSQADIAFGMGSQSVEVKVLMVGTKTFIGGSTVLAAVPAAKGKTWIFADPDSANPTIKQIATSMSAAGGSSSSIESFTKFAAAAKSVEKGGNSTVNGVDTTEWKVELDPTKLGSSASAAGSAAATFYLDSDNRMRRAKIGIETGSVEIVLTMDMTSYNKPVRITAPDPSTVYTG